MTGRFTLRGFVLILTHTSFGTSTQLSTGFKLERKYKFLPKLFEVQANNKEEQEY